MPSPSSVTPVAAQPDFSRMRHVQDKNDLQLSTEGVALLASLAAEVCPTKLAAAFPRIVNRMASLWKSPRQMDRYFEDLLTDTRGNRQGFPLAILMELTTLKDYYLIKFPPLQRDLWSEDGLKSRTT